MAYNNMRKTILIIDDELGYRVLLSSDLSKVGYTVLTAASGPDALKVLDENPVDMIITDMKMSPMDGLDTIVAIRKAYPSVPIVLMTGHALEERVQEAMSHRIDTCLRKPFGIHEVRDVVNTLVGTGA